MYTTIYIDVLLFVNLFVNYFILLATEKICRQRTTVFRRIIGDIVASASSLVIFLPEMNFVLSLITRFMISAVIVFTAFGFKNIRRFFILVGGFYSVSFAYAGICLAVWAVFRPKGLIIRNDAIYFNISPLLLIVTSLVCYFLLLILRRFFGKDHMQSLYYQIQISKCEKSVTLNAFLDSGNQLYDVFSNAPVIIVDFARIKSLLPENDRETLMNFGGDFSGKAAITGYRLIPYSVVGGKGLLPAFRPDQTVVYKGKEKIEIDDCLIALSNDLGGENEALIGKDLLERKA